ncbi:hypothetical protein CBW65_04820 [Tumebacillus avium]|uniref:Uncharacterized protein n=1 Tax=Tumebacillus avium TaxID=1903704 RepID=A0A1Y0IJL4_9BACL|nr:hypothetical protein [Tumebacillus avium]ARU60470.1 hypothetical protein CBW65_04820 [Tumebacillus avium]
MKKILFIAAAIIVLNFFLIAGEDEMTASTYAQVIVTYKTPCGEENPCQITVQNQMGQQTEITVEQNVWNLIEPETAYIVNYTQEGNEPAVLTSIERAVVTQTTSL